MQESAPGDMLFPVDADQAHYLTVMTNRWRWRTPSPGYDNAPSNASSNALDQSNSAPSPLKPARSRSSTTSPSLESAHLLHHHRLSPTASPTDPEGVALTRCGLIVGEGEGVPLGDGQSCPSPSWAASEICDIDVKPHQNAHHHRPPPPADDDEAEAEAGVDEASGDSEVTLLLLTEGMTKGDDSDPGGREANHTDGQKDFVFSIDSSRAASLTRTCKWAGYKKVTCSCTTPISVHVWSDSC